MVTVQGFYKNGKLLLKEKPVGLPDGEVVVHLEQYIPTNGKSFLKFGQFRGSNQSSIEDYIDAEWHGTDLGK